MRVRALFVWALLALIGEARDKDDPTQFAAAAAAAATAAAKAEPATKAKAPAEDAAAAAAAAAKAKAEADRKAAEAAAKAKADAAFRKRRLEEGWSRVHLLQDTIVVHSNGKGVRGRQAGHGER